MFFAEGEHRAEIERIAQRVGQHDGFCFPRRESGFQLIHAGVSGRRIVVDEHGDTPVLDDGSDGGGKSGGAGDDLVSGPDALVIRKLVGRKAGECNQVGRRSRIDEKTVFDAEECGEFALESLAFGAKREPEIKSRGDSGFDLVLRENAAGVGDGR